MSDKEQLPNEKNFLCKSTLAIFVIIQYSSMSSSATETLYNAMGQGHCYRAMEHAMVGGQPLVHCQMLKDTIKSN